MIKNVDILDPPLGIVTLDNKKKPVKDRKIIDNEYMIYKRESININNFKEFLLNHQENIWDEEYHQKNNIKMNRPFHDNWNIKKIMFIWSDDFLQKVFEFPLYHNPVWNNYISEIFKKCGIRKEQVVRALLANMTPNTYIPLHHDTGHWVRYVHRIHVAISTNVDKVDFFVLHKEENGTENMRKINFSEGEIIELNNQAYHEVVNNWDQDRIHFIFDYVENDYETMYNNIRRYELSIGDDIYQTRRNAYIKDEEETSKIPAFIIIGAQKSGTTSMYEYICQHKKVMPGITRELHYFDWFYEYNTHLSDTEHLNKYYQYYDSGNEYVNYDIFVTGESTPNYMLRPDIVIPRMLRIIPHLRKFIVMLRNPTYRAFSQYRMYNNFAPSVNSNNNVYKNQNFYDIVVNEINMLQSKGIHVNMDKKDFYKILSILPSGHGCHSIVLRGLYALQLIPWFEEFGFDNIKIVSISQLNNENIHNTMSEVFQFIGLPNETIKDVDPKNMGINTTMDENVKKVLDDFYHPFNEQLFKLLGYRIDNW